MTSIMEKIVLYFKEILSQKAIIRIDSVPKFTYEIFISIFICLTYLILHYEVIKIGRLNTHQAHRLIYKRSLKVCSSNDSLCTSVTHIKCGLNKLSSTTAQLKFKKYLNGDAFMFFKTSETGDENNNNIIDKFVSITPNQYVKMEKERKIREKDLEDCLKSLTTLCSNVLDNKLSQSTIQKQIQEAREELLFPQPINKYLGFDTAALTNSLFDLLENIITESSIEKPLPFKGDLTTFAMNAGNFNTDVFTKAVKNRNEDDSISCDSTMCTTILTERSSSQVDSVTEGKLITI